MSSLDTAIEYKGIILKTCYFGSKKWSKKVIKNNIFLNIFLTIKNDIKKTCLKMNELFRHCYRVYWDNTENSLKILF